MDLLGKDIFSETRMTFHSTPWHVCLRVCTCLGLSVTSCCLRCDDNNRKWPLQDTGQLWAKEASGEWGVPMEDLISYGKVNLGDNTCPGSHESILINT